ncbi:hypothetical protein YPPY91_4494, partial [Yersinia pestis PY-91]
MASASLRVILSTAKRFDDQEEKSLSIILCNCHRIKGDRSGG